MDFLLKTFKDYTTKPAICWKKQEFSYDWLTSKVISWSQHISDLGVEEGNVVGLKGDFTPEAISLFLALIYRKCVVVPFLKTTSQATLTDSLETAEAKYFFSISDSGDLSENVEFTNFGREAKHPLIRELSSRSTSGLILFSSGSSGRPKAAVHDFSKLLVKFQTKRAALKILNFLLFDHWGGLNTMLHTLSSGGTVLTVQDRTPDGIGEAIQRYGVEVLPASPTFLNLMLISQIQKRHDLSSLKIISYGTEPMPESLLSRLQATFPHVKLQQTYGLIELGVLRSKSKSSDSLWVKIGGEGYQTRVVDGLLEIKADSAMLGYLNAPSPFTDDGWFKTGDSVEVDGEFLRILGRKSEQINVGGEKVYPQEVESLIQSLDNVAEVTVFGQKNPIMGNIVCATVRLVSEEDPKIASQRIKKICREKLASFKVPVKIEIVEQSGFNHRFKKIRVKEI
jgi:acyl-coenzyme A synthetase/AMP-(fatty) acid ligase